MKALGQRDDRAYAAAPLANPADPRLPAKDVFGRAITPVEAKARSIGCYWRGCLAGAKALAFDGESWQVGAATRMLDAHAGEAGAAALRIVKHPALDG